MGKAAVKEQLYEWRKTASARWADAWEERVCGAVGAERVALARKGPGAKLLAITAYNLTAAEAALLEREFGGAARRQSGTDWAALTSRPLAPLRVRGRLVVSGGAPPPDGEKEGVAWLRIGASAAFGTGGHATTAMCLRFLADLDLSGARVLDAGCGTGILALAALKLGAARAVAVDNDPMAVRVAREHARLNGLARRTRVAQGQVSAETAGEGPFDVICANLFAGLLERLFPLFESRLAEGGRLICSGVLREQEAEVARAAEQAGLRVLETRRRGKWVAFIAERA